MDPEVAIILAELAKLVAELYKTYRVETQPWRALRDRISCYEAVFWSRYRRSDFLGAAKIAEALEEATRVLKVNEEAARWANNAAACCVFAGDIGGAYELFRHLRTEVDRSRRFPLEVQAIVYSNLLYCAFHHFSSPPYLQPPEDIVNVASTLEGWLLRIPADGKRLAKHDISTWIQVESRKPLNHGYVPPYNSLARFYGHWLVGRWDKSLRYYEADFFHQWPDAAGPGLAPAFLTAGTGLIEGPTNLHRQAGLLLGKRSFPPGSSFYMIGHFYSGRDMLEAKETGRRFISSRAYDWFVRVVDSPQVYYYSRTCITGSQKHPCATSSATGTSPPLKSTTSAGSRPPRAPATRC